jgi:hypothetical protein
VPSPGAIRRLPLAVLAAVMAATASSCGGSGPKPRPDLLFVSTRDKSYEIY